jgi:hypothetical protein
MDMGSTSGIRAMNLTHTGEMGWVLYIPNEAAQNYDVTGTVHRLTPDYVTSGQYEVDIAGLRYNARVSPHSLTNNK